MEIKLEIPKYDPNQGIRISWVDGHSINVILESKEVSIVANQAGLITLALQLLTLAQDEIPSGRHIHLTNVSGLDEKSMDLTLTKG